MKYYMPTATACILCKIENATDSLEAAGIYII